MSTWPWRSVVALSGGVGGARLLDGLARQLGPEALTAIVNTADDFEHWGLPISPDLDTVMYTLARLADDERGWGLRDETFHCLRRMAEYGEPSWFQLGDRDLATHLYRRQRLADGATLSEVTRELCRALRVGVRLLPMADAPRRTHIHTDTHGTLPFQQWLVHHHARPGVRAVVFEGTSEAAPGVLDAIGSADLVVLTPSNPYVSLDPILSLRGVRDALNHRTVVGVSPIAGGRAIKGPLASMIPALAGEPASAAAIARHHADYLTGLLVHTGDAIDTPKVATRATDILMPTPDERQRLAGELLQFARTLRHPARQ